MKYTTFSYITFLVGILLFTGCSPQKPPLSPLTYSGEEIRVQDPLSPEASMTHIQVPDGFGVRLFASEPDIINPIAFAWDEAGRLWVVQSHDYPHKQTSDVGGDRITICEDTDGDGTADKFIEFATEQHLTTGITLVKGGAIVAQAPDIAFLEDTDGDDKMDKRTVLFTGFGTWDTHAVCSNLKYGVDNHLWGAVGYSGFEGSFQGDSVKFKMGVYRFAKDGSQFEPVGQFNNNTWGLGFNVDFEIFGSTANNNHCCYVGIPLRYYSYLEKLPSWAVNADFIQGHYDISPVDTIPLQQVDVRDGYTAAAGANFYTARNYPEEYQNQMYVCAPTGHLVHIARIVPDGAGYKEVDGGNIFASTDAWTAPVFAKTGPDGNLWIADWYNPVIQHNPDKRGMENQIWNAVKGEGNAHVNPLRDYHHGRIYILTYEGAGDADIVSLDRQDDEALLDALSNRNMFWRTTAQRLIVEEQKTTLIPDLIGLIENDLTKDKNGFHAPGLHALWTLDGLGALDGDYPEAEEVVVKALNSSDYGVIRAGLVLLPVTNQSSEQLAASGLLNSPDPKMRLAALLKAGQLPETQSLFSEIETMIKDEVNRSDKWIDAAIKIYFREENKEIVNPERVDMILPTAEEGRVTWRYTTVQPADNWMSSDFDDKEWKPDAGKFGGDNVGEVNTRWTSRDIWLRHEVEIRDELTEPVIKIAHDDDYEIYVNGQLLISETGASGTYKYVRLENGKGGLFRKGTNLVAVHCVNTGGDQYIDVGIGRLGQIPSDITLVLSAVNQKMAYDKTTLHATAGQTLEIVLHNKDQMPHNLVLLRPGTLEVFGGMVDEFTTNPDAEELAYVPPSKYVLGATEMVQPDESGSVFITLPEIPGIYPYVCTFPGHWRMMQGVIIVTAPGSYISENNDAPQITVMGGGSSHDFLTYFGIADGKILSDQGQNTVLYTEDPPALRTMLPSSDILVITNNQSLDRMTRDVLMNRVNGGQMNLLINHPGIWYNWPDWPEYNKLLVGGGSRSHEPLQEFEVEVIRPDHPIMQGVPLKFRIVDELYRWEKVPEAEIEILAIGRGLESGEEFPVVWTVSHPTTNIVCNTLGHDGRAHGHPAYQAILKNSVNWMKKLTPQ